VAEPAPEPELPPDLEEAAEVVESDLSALAGERDQYLDQLRRVQADFENYRKRVLKQQDELAERATESLVADLLPVLDACDAAAQHGDEAAAPIAKALVDVLTKQGLEKVAPEGEAFDPNQHDAVAHEEGEGDGGPTVAEVLRPGYVWKGRVLRPAMVRVRG
jgi:molecular chaperone GrpE